MARSDLLTTLVKAGVTGDKRSAARAAEAIVAEERAKQHHVLADRLAAIIEDGNGSQAPAAVGEYIRRGRDSVIEVRPRRHLRDLILPETVRRVVNQLVQEQLRADLLRAHGIEPRNRVLLVGAPGTGKTTLAEAIAEAIAVPLLVVRYDAIIGSYLGETASRLQRVFDYARTTPCVLFFDEFDVLGKERGDVHETGEIKRVVSSLLLQIDDLPSYTVVAGATNHPELLDRATWRRFQLRCVLPLPDTKAVACYVEGFAGRLEQPLGHSPAVIAKRLGPVSYAEAEQFCLDLLRRHILSLGEQPVKELVSEQLAIWSERARSSNKSDIEQNMEGSNHASQAAVDAPSAARDSATTNR
jgi:AAA+ superfamily predicted ATPase